MTWKVFLRHGLWSSSVVFWKTVINFSRSLFESIDGTCRCKLSFWILVLSKLLLPSTDKSDNTSARRVLWWSFLVHYCSSFVVALLLSYPLEERQKVCWRHTKLPHFSFFISHDVMVQTDLIIHCQKGKWIGLLQYYGFLHACLLSRALRHLSLRTGLKLKHIHLKGNDNL